MVYLAQILNIYSDIYVKPCLVSLKKDYLFRLESAVKKILDPHAMLVFFDIALLKLLGKLENIIFFTLALLEYFHRVLLWMVFVKAAS